MLALWVCRCCARQVQNQTRTLRLTSCQLLIGCHLVVQAAISAFMARKRSTLQSMVARTPSAFIKALSMRYGER
jgi:hypothetical protein